MLHTSDYVLAKFLNCDVFQCSTLDSITMDVDELFDKAEDKTLNGLAEAMYESALEYLQAFYDFANDTIMRNPHLYDGSVLNWDADLLSEALDYLDPKKDLHYGIDSNDIYLELDNWDLYQLVVGTINEDYGSGMSFKDLDHDFCYEFNGGADVPAKFDSLLFN